MSNWVPKFHPQINLKDPRIIENIIEIEAFKKSTLKIPLPPGFIEKFNKLNIVRAIKGTTGIEGNTLSEEIIGKLVDEARLQPNNLEEIEVLNANKALGFIKSIKKEKRDIILTEEIIKHIHYILTDGCDYKDNIPGEYRHHQSVVGEYHPPQHGDIADLMRRFLDYINSREIIEGYTTIIRAVLAHFYLVSIHPFGDGNGRTSRAIEALILYSAGYNIVGFYSLSNFFYKNRAKYIEELQAARFKYHENLMSFTLFALGGYKSELESIQDEILLFVKERFYKDYVDQLLHLHGVISPRINDLLFYLVNLQIKLPEIALKSRSDQIIKNIYSGVSERTFYRDLETIDKYNLLNYKDGYVSANIDVLNQFLES